MSFPDKTPELPKFRRVTGGTLQQRRTGGLRAFRPSEGGEALNLADALNSQPGSASVPNGHSQPLQPLRRRLPPEKLPEIGELLKNIGLDEESKENHRRTTVDVEIEALGHRDMPPPSNCVPQCEQPLTPQGRFSGSKSAIRMFAPMSKIIAVKGKEYMVIGDLGSGGSCKVYSALHEGQIVAIKDVTLPDEAAVRENYIREIQMLRKLNDCEQVVRLFDYEESEGKILMVMEKGDSDLSTVLQCASKDWITVRFFWRDMLHAVERIHKLGIIHQDLKPANFIVVKGRLKLIDFGISDDIGDATSVFRDCAIGTFNYMSPEIIQQSREACIKTSRASDIWSLGCILYSLAFGQPPFAHIKNIHSKVLAIVNPKHEIHYPPDADPDLIDVLRKCLLRQPKERATAEQLLKHDFVLGPPAVRTTYKNV